MGDGDDEGGGDNGDHVGDGGCGVVCVCVFPTWFPETPSKEKFPTCFCCSLPWAFLSGIPYWVLYSFL